MPARCSDLFVLSSISFCSSKFSSAPVRGVSKSLSAYCSLRYPPRVMFLTSCVSVCVFFRVLFHRTSFTCKPFVTRQSFHAQPAIVVNIHWTSGCVILYDKQKTRHHRTMFDAENASRQRLRAQATRKPDGHNECRPTHLQMQCISRDGRRWLSLSAQSKMAIARMGHATSRNKTDAECSASSLHSIRLFSG